MKKLFPIFLFTIGVYAQPITNVPVYSRTNLTNLVRGFIVQNAGNSNLVFVSGTNVIGVAPSSIASPIAPGPDATIKITSSGGTNYIETTNGIARSKISSGTADHVVINSGTGALSSEAQLALSRGGTATALTDPNGTYIAFWNDAATKFDWMSLGKGFRTTIINNITNIYASGEAEGESYIIIGGTNTTTTANGTQLINTYTYAKTRTPYGGALGQTNRYTIFLLPGIYDLGSSTLTMDTEYIDLIGISPKTGTIFYDSTLALDYGETIITSSSTTLVITGPLAAGNDQDITVANVCLRATSNTSTDYCLGATREAWRKKFKLINVLLQRDGSPSPKYAFEPEKSLMGTFVDVRNFQDNSFGNTTSGSIELGGNFIRCKAGGYSFGAASTTGVCNLTGNFIDNEADGNSFGAGGSGAHILSGNFLRNRYVVVSTVASGMFGAGSGTPVTSGFFQDCVANTITSFGKTMSGTMIGCKGTVAFTTISGIIKACVFNGYIGEEGMGQAVITNYARFPVSTLTYNSGSNLNSIILTNASVFRLLLTNDAFFVAPTGMPTTNQCQTIILQLLQDSTGGRTVTMTNGSWVVQGSGQSTNAVLSITTNANAITMLTFATGLYSNKLYGTVTPFVP